MPTINSLEYPVTASAEHVPSHLQHNSSMGTWLKFSKGMHSVYCVQVALFWVSPEDAALLLLRPVHCGLSRSALQLTGCL